MTGLLIDLKLINHDRYKSPRIQLTEPGGGSQNSLIRSWTGNTTNPATGFLPTKQNSSSRISHLRFQLSTSHTKRRSLQ